MQSISVEEDVGCNFICHREDGVATSFATEKMRTRVASSHAHSGGSPQQTLESQLVNREVHQSC